MSGSSDRPPTNPSTAEHITATDQLIELAGGQGNLDELRRFADQGNTTAAEQSRSSMGEHVVVI